VNAGAFVENPRLVVDKSKNERRSRRECLHDRHIHPDLFSAAGEDDLETRAEPGACAADAPAISAGARVSNIPSVAARRAVDAHAAAEQLDLQLDGFQHGH